MVHLIIWEDEAVLVFSQKLRYIMVYRLDSIKANLVDDYLHFDEKFFLKSVAVSQYS